MPWLPVPAWRKPILPLMLTYSLAVPAGAQALQAATITAVPVDVQVTASIGSIGVTGPAGKKGGPAVKVLDGGGRPVAGAAVAFTIQPGPGGAGASFPGGSLTRTVQSNADGDAIADEFHPNAVTGLYTVTAAATKAGMQSSPARVIGIRNELLVRTLTVEPGDTFVNNLCKKTSGEPKVIVRDEGGKPVVGATVLFRLPDSGPSGVFTGASATHQVTTDDNGEAVVQGFVPNKTTGDFEVDAVASLATLRGSAVVSGSNVKQGCFPTLLVVIIGGGAAGGAAAALGSRKSNSPSTSTTTATPPAPTPSVITITPGTPVFGGH